MAEMKAIKFNNKNMANKEITTDGDYTIYPVSGRVSWFALLFGIPQYYMAYDPADDRIHIGYVTKAKHKVYVERNCEGIIAHETMHKILYHIISVDTAIKLDNDTFFNTFLERFGQKYPYKKDPCGFSITFLRRITHKHK